MARYAGPKKEIAKAGVIAIDLVNRTLFQTGNFKFRKPSITNYPAYVPVIVDSCPAAKSPAAQIYLADFPKLPSKPSAAVKSPPFSTFAISAGSSLFLMMKTANVAITKVLMKNEIPREIALSTAL